MDNPKIVGMAAEVNKRIREISRKKLVAYLGAISHRNYKPENLENLNERIKNHMTRNEELMEELKSLKETMMKTNNPDELKSLRAKNEQLEAELRGVRNHVSNEVGKHIQEKSAVIMETVQKPNLISSTLAGAATGTLVGAGNPVVAFVGALYGAGCYFFSGN